MATTADIRWAWRHISKGQVRSDYHYNSLGAREYNASYLFHFDISVPPPAAGKKISTITLPNDTKNALHVFALSAVPVAAATQPTIKDKVVPAFARATRRWTDVGSYKAQVVEVAVRNPLSLSRHADTNAWAKSPIEVSLVGTGFETILKPKVLRLSPGDEVLVNVGVKPTGATGDFTDAKVQFASAEGTWEVPVVVGGSHLVHDFTQWKQEGADVEQHSSPEWYNDAKFGIFIHWGIYAVSAWSDGSRYSEWYDYWLHNDNVNGTVYNHHKNTWGTNVTYDDFIPKFTAEKFNASEWVKLFSDAGAGYFVLTTKHHDGFALFDTKETSDRNSVKLGPKRDFLRELMDTAAAEQPHLKRGTYFSMPEWYNPLYKVHGRYLFPGGLAHNPYTGVEEPYTGFKDSVKEYVTGVQYPQMKMLAEEYKTDIMWCDIGMDNNSTKFAAEWYAQTAAEGRQVVIDNRCGIAGDFITPEMTKFDTVQLQKWESCASMDPYSFGYSAATRDDQYRSATNIIQSLVDIVAKGGNFLLNVGPKADGTIIPAMADPLREAGKWLKTNGRAIYKTSTFPLVPEVKTATAHVEITRTDKTFNLISVQDPATPTTVLPGTFPILSSDKINLVTDHGDVPVPFTYDGATLKLDLSKVTAQDRTGKPAYVFEVVYGTGA